MRAPISVKSIFELFLYLLSALRHATPGFRLSFRAVAASALRHFHEALYSLPLPTTPIVVLSPPLLPASCPYIFALAFVEAGFGPVYAVGSLWNRSFRAPAEIAERICHDGFLVGSGSGGLRT